MYIFDAYTYNYFETCYAGVILIVYRYLRLIQTPTLESWLLFDRYGKLNSLKFPELFDSTGK